MVLKRRLGTTIRAPSLKQNNKMLKSSILLALAGIALAAPAPALPAGMRRHVVRANETYEPGSPQAHMAEQVRREIGNDPELIKRKTGEAVAFIVYDASAITMSRMDPIGAPGEVAPHVHIVQGANNFRSELDNRLQADVQTCSTRRANSRTQTVPLLLSRATDQTTGSRELGSEAPLTPDRCTTVTTMASSAQRRRELHVSTIERKGPTSSPSRKACA